MNVRPRLSWLMPEDPEYVAVRTSEGEPVLVFRPGVPLRAYDVFADAPILFRHFVEAGGTDDGLHVFACLYGSLGLQTAFRVAEGQRWQMQTQWVHDWRTHR